MTKIKDIKGIVDKLPERDVVIRQDTGYECVRQGRNEMRSYVLNTDLNLEDIVEVDVDALKKRYLMFAQECWLTDVYTKDQAEKCFDRMGIAKARVVIWKK